VVGGVGFLNFVPERGHISTAVRPQVRMQPAHETPIKLFYASVGVLPAPFIFIFTRIRQIVTTLLLRSARYIFRWMPKHMQFESLETRRIRVIVHLVGIRSKRPFHPFLKKRFLFELA